MSHFVYLFICWWSVYLLAMGTYCYKHECTTGRCLYEILWYNPLGSQASLLPGIFRISFGSKSGRSWLKYGFTLYWLYNLSQVALCNEEIVIFKHTVVLGIKLDFAQCLICCKNSINSLPPFPSNVLSLLLWPLMHIVFLLYYKKSHKHIHETGGGLTPLILKINK